MNLSCFNFAQVKEAKAKVIRPRIRSSWKRKMIDRAVKIRLIFTKREPPQPIFRFAGISIERTGDLLIFSAFYFPRLMKQAS